MLLPQREECDMKSIVLGIACACVAVSAEAQQQSPPSSPFILKEVTTNFPKADRLEARVETATLEPGKIGGWHTHPTPVVVYVIEGTLTVEIKGKDPIITKAGEDRKSTRLNSSHANISYAVFCL